VKAMRQIRIRERDRKLARHILLHRMATRDQMIALGHFSSVARCNQRVSQLVSAGWLRKIPNVNGLAVQQGLYAVGPSAVPELLQTTDLPIDEISRCCTPNEGPILVEHSIKLLDFRLALEMGAPGASIDIIEWLCEAECLHEFHVQRGSSSSWSQTIIKPDSYVRIRKQGVNIDCFVEIDLGHVSVPRFTEKLRRYELYLQSGAFTDIYGTSEFRVLTVTVGERRLFSLANIPCKVRHLSTSWQRIERSSPFGCKWQIGNDEFMLPDALAL
jgi:hypothetical protein